MVKARVMVRASDASGSHQDILECGCIENFAPRGHLMWVDKCSPKHKREYAMAKARLGSGVRFKAVEASAAASGARDPAAVAAAAGRAKYGNKRMAKMAAAGRKRASY